MSIVPSSITHASDASYRAFLLRCWQEPDGEAGAPGWRFSVTEVNADRPRWGCEGLDELLLLLRNRLAEGHIRGDQATGAEG